MKKKMKFTQEDYLKANRKASREEEIEKHGRPVSFNRIHVSKKYITEKGLRQATKTCLICLRGQHST